MYEHRLIPTLTYLILFIFPSFLQADNSSCGEAMLVATGTYEVEAFSGNGAVFEGATAAVWYRFEPTERGVFTVSSCDGGGNTRLVVMLLDDCTATSNIQIINSVEDNCADGKGGMTASTLDVVAVPGFSFVIYWDNGQSEDGFTWNLTFEPEVTTPPGAACETAEMITDGDHQIDTLVGTGAAFLDAVSAKWYSYTPEFDGVLWINSCSSNIDTRLFIWGGVCGALQIYSQDDNGCTGSNAASLDGQLTIVEGGKTYYIYWDDHGSNKGFEFNVFLGPLPTSVKEPNWAKDLTLYPNPVDNQLFIDYDFEATTDLQVTILNNLGQQLWLENWQSFQKGRLELPTDNLAEGLYFLNLKTAKAQVTKTFIVNRF